jgi:hypothetical protein
MKYSSDLLGGMFSNRNGINGTPLLTARSTSRLICGDSFAFAENNSTITFDAAIASMIAAPQSCPGRMSRGAIQHRTLLASRYAHTASAVTLSFEE